MMLNSLEIKNFRSLEDFQVKKLGQVNLIVGKNNCGKSSVLEALRIYAGNANKSLLENIALSHDEKYTLDDDEPLPFEDSFTDRKFPVGEKAISIGELNNTKDALTIYHVYRVEKEYSVTDDEGNTRKEIRQLSITQKSLANYNHILGNGLLVKKKDHTALIDFNLQLTSLRRLPQTGNAIPYSYIPTQLISMDDLAKEWDSIALTDAEKTVKQAMQIILPDFENLTFVNASTNNGKTRRLAKVKLKGLSHPIPLKSLGDGMQHILQLVLKISPAKGGFLLIDEFENGLHYSVQEKVWHLLFELAEKLDIQIFATTHSWDCIESFAKVAVAKQDVDGVLFRVGKSVRNSDKGRVIATVFEEEQLYNITQSDVEVR